MCARSPPARSASIAAGSTITVNGATVELAVTNLAFAGSSYINANNDTYAWTYAVNCNLRGEITI